MQPGEADELLAFAREHLPRLHEAMEQVRMRDPGKLQARLSEHAPRLRQLRRVFSISPRIGQVIQQHAEHLFQIRREVRALRQADPESALYRSTVQSLREHVAEHVNLEIDALRALAAESEARAPQRVEARIDQLLSPDSSLAAVPPRIREQVRAYHEAETDEQRDEARQRIRQDLARAAGAEVEALRQQAAKLQQNAAGEVDERVQRMLDRPRLQDADRPRQPEADDDEH